MSLLSVPNKGFRGLYACDFSNMKANYGRDRRGDIFLFRKVMASTLARFSMIMTRSLLSTYLNTEDLT